MPRRSEPAVDVAKYRVRPGSVVSLGEYDASDSGGLSKSEGKALTRDLKARLHLLQELFYANGEHALLVILQGMDASGKDGVIERVISAFDPQGFQVTAFKVPTAEELAHDFLWRVHKQVPARGMIGVFNRSHYEDVLVARVDALVPESVWRNRYEAIRHFEMHLAEDDVLILKFFLYISKEEQRRRLEDRLHDPTEQWKFRAGDLAARAKWDAYMAAYEAALEQCSLEEAPWYVIPADRKWYRDLLIAQVLVSTLESLQMRWPALPPELRGLVIE